MAVTVSGFRTEGGSVSSGGKLTHSYRVEDFTGRSPRSDEPCGNAQRQPSPEASRR
jgi:hypothetical protein